MSCIHIIFLYTHTHLAIACFSGGAHLHRQASDIEVQESRVPAKFRDSGGEALEVLGRGIFQGRGFRVRALQASFTSFLNFLLVPGTTAWLTSAPTSSSHMQSPHADHTILVVDHDLGPITYQGLRTLELFVFSIGPLGFPSTLASPKPFFAPEL